MNILAPISLALFGIIAGNYSAISHIDDNRYVIVDDKDSIDGFKYLTIQMDSITGKILNAEMTEPIGMTQRRAEGTTTNFDCEGIAYCKESNSVFVSEETNQRIIEYTLDGTPTGRELAIPKSFGKNAIRGNLGFEALCYDQHSKLFWTTSESTLKADGEASTLTTLTNNRLRLQSFGTDLTPKKQYAYLMDMPTIPNGKKGTYVFGVPSMLSMNDSTLLVMEREVFVPTNKLGSFCTIKLYMITPSEQNLITNDTNLATLPTDRFMAKKLLTTFTTHLRIGKADLANYEGMCLGPKLADGRQTIILIADSQKGAGNSLFHLKDYLRVIILD